MLALIISVSADAQRKIRLLSRIDTPTINQNIITGSTTFPVYVIKNVGTNPADSLGAGEQIRFASPTSVLTPPASLSGTTLTLGQVLKIGDSVRISSATITGGYSVKFDSIKSLYNSTATAFTAKPFTANTQYVWFFSAYGANSLIGNPTIDSVFYNLDTQKIWINKSSAINETFSTVYESIKTYPNPAVNQLSFEYNFVNNENAVVKIMDVTGRVVYENIYVNNSGNQKFDLDINSLNNGSYMLNFIVGDKTMTNKFTVQK